MLPEGVFRDLAAIETQSLFDRVTSTLDGTDIAAHKLIAIKTATGAGTAVGPTRYAVIGLGERFL
jgi:hypothetical protein